MERYARNRETITEADQAILKDSQVAVVGCGGLGGYVLEQLARLGLGHLTVIDGDVFDISNLNRQLFATVKTIGCKKAVVVKSRLSEVNPHVAVTAYPERLTSENAKELLAGSQIVVDALDNLPSRLLLEEACCCLRMPLVHGAIAGWYGQLAVIQPGQRRLGSLYPITGQQGMPPSVGIERNLGNPAFAPGVVASLQVAEVTKLLLGRESPLQHHTLRIDLLEMEFVLI